MPKSKTGVNDGWLADGADLNVTTIYEHYRAVRERIAAAAREANEPKLALPAPVPVRPFMEEEPRKLDPLSQARVERMKERFGDIGPTFKSRIMNEIEQVVLSQYHVSLEEVLGRTRVARVCQARFAAMHYLRYQHNLSLSQIGRWFNKDHTTVLSAIRRHEMSIGGQS